MWIIFVPFFSETVDTFCKYIQPGNTSAHLLIRANDNDHMSYHISTRARLRFAISISLFKSMSTLSLRYTSYINICYPNTSNIKRADVARSVSTVNVHIPNPISQETRNTLRLMMPSASILIKESVAQSTLSISAAGSVPNVHEMCNFLRGAFSTYRPQCVFYTWIFPGKGTNNDHHSGFSECEVKCLENNPQ